METTREQRRQLATLMVTHPEVILSIVSDESIARVVKELIAEHPVPKAIDLIDDWLTMVMFIAERGGM